MSCESCQALSALFPIAGGASCKYGGKENHSDYTSDYKRQKSEFQIYIATNVATTKSNVQKDRISGLVQKKNWNLFSNNSGDGECLRLFLLRKKSASIAI